MEANMSIVSDCAEHIKSIKPNTGDTAEAYARRRFYAQMEFYSAHAGRDLYQDGDFEWLEPSIRHDWIARAESLIAGGE
jgi:hypothetical protein